jgi:hypothetical protein
MKKLRKGLIVLAAVLLVGLNGCSTSPKPFEYETHRELKPGPGLFSGEDGYFKIYQQQHPSKGKSDKGSETKEDYSQQPLVEPVR